MYSPVQCYKATAWSFIQTANFEEELYLHDTSVAIAIKNVCALEPTTLFFLDTFVHDTKG